jgi:hypothetical protein
MDEVRIVKHRTHIWPVIIALVVLAIVIAYVFFAMNGPANEVGWNELRPDGRAAAVLTGVKS